MAKGRYPSRKELESMKRPELQKLSKECSIKANASSEAMVEALVQHYETEAKRSASTRLPESSSSLLLDKTGRRKLRSVAMPSQPGGVPLNSEAERQPPAQRQVDDIPPVTISRIPTASALARAKPPSRTRQLRQNQLGLGKPKTARPTVNDRPSATAHPKSSSDEKTESQNSLPTTGPPSENFVTPPPPMARRKAKEAQIRLGVGRPRVAGGLGVRKSATRSPPKVRGMAAAGRTKGKAPALPAVADVVTEEAEEEKASYSAPFTFTTISQALASQTVPSPSQSPPRSHSAMISFTPKGSASQFPAYSDGLLARVARLEMLSMLPIEDGMAPESSAMAQFRDELNALRSLKTDLESIRQQVKSGGLQDGDMNLEPRFPSRDLLEVRNRMEVVVAENTQLKKQLRDQEMQLTRMAGDVAELQQIRSEMNSLVDRMTAVERSIPGPRRVSGEEPVFSPLAPAPDITPGPRAKSPAHAEASNTTNLHTDPLGPVGIPPSVLGKRARDSSASLSDASSATITTGNLELRRDVLTKGRPPPKKRFKPINDSSDEPSATEADFALTPVPAPAPTISTFSFADPPAGMTGSSITSDFFAAQVARRPSMGGTMGRSASYAEMHKDDPPINQLPYPIAAAVAQPQAPMKLISPRSPSPQKGDKGLYLPRGAVASLGEGSSSGVGRIGRVFRGPKFSNEVGPYAAPVTPQNPSRRIRSQNKAEVAEDVDSDPATPSPVTAIVTPPAPTNSLLPAISPISLDNDPIERLGMPLHRNTLFETPKMRPVSLEDPTPPPMLKTMYGTERAGDDRFADPNEWPRRW